MISNEINIFFDAISYSFGVTPVRNIHHQRLLFYFFFLIFILPRSHLPFIIRFSVGCTWSYAYTSLLLCAPSLHLNELAADITLIRSRYLCSFQTNTLFPFVCFRAGSKLHTFHTDEPNKWKTHFNLFFHIHIHTFPLLLWTYFAVVLCMQTTPLGNIPLNRFKINISYTQNICKALANLFSSYFNIIVGFSYAKIGGGPMFSHSLCSWKN